LLKVVDREKHREVAITEYHDLLVLAVAVGGVTVMVFPEPPAPAGTRMCAAMSGLMAYSHSHTSSPFRVCMRKPRCDVHTENVLGTCNEHIDCHARCVITEGGQAGSGGLQAAPIQLKAGNEQRFMKAESNAIKLSEDSDSDLPEPPLPPAQSRSQ
jgi:hypothetical protein